MSVSISPLSIQISIAPLTGLAFCLAARLSQKLPVLVILVKRENKSTLCVCVSMLSHVAAFPLAQIILPGMNLKTF